MAASVATAWLDLRVARQLQLFNSMDPAPFRERDLDPDVATYVQEWAEELGLAVPLGIRVTLIDAPFGEADEAALRHALHSNFARCAALERRNLRKLFRDGCISLVIGVGFVALAIAIADLAAARIASPRYAQLVADSVVIGAWVALWHPVNIFLYEWWPIRRSRKLYERLARARVELRAAGALA